MQVEGVIFNGVQRWDGVHPDQHVFTDMETHSTNYFTNPTTEQVIAWRDQHRKDWANACREG